MNIVEFIIMLIGVLICVWLLFSNFGRVWKLVYNSIFGMLALLLVNFLGSPFNINMGINGVTCLICGFLGIPGFITLFILKLFI